MQIVSVFAIGFNKHFNAETGADASVTNSNSNFGQFAIASDGFKKEAFTKDDNAYITQILAPKAITSTQTNIDWQRLDVGLTTSVGITSHLYLFGFNTKDNVPPVVIQGYRVGAQTNDSVFVDFASVNDGSSVTGYGVSSASILMVDNEISTTGITSALGTTSSIKKYTVQSGPTSNILTLGAHELLTGEKIRIIRTKIDEIDLKILNLISERKDLVTEIVKFKNRNQIIDQERISKILESLDAEASKRGIPRALVRKLWEGMIQSFISYEEELFDKSKN